MRYCVIVMSCNVGSQGSNETADDCLLNPSPAERVYYAVQLPTSAVNVTLLAFTAEHRPFSNRSMDLVAAGPTAANPPQRRVAVE